MLSHLSLSLSHTPSSALSGCLHTTSIAYAPPPACALYRQAYLASSSDDDDDDSSSDDDNDDDDGDGDGDGDGDEERAEGAGGKKKSRTAAERAVKKDKVAAARRARKLLLRDALGASDESEEGESDVDGGRGGADDSAGEGEVRWAGRGAP